MAHGIRVAVAAAALSVSMAGCIATEQWTQDVLGKREAEIDGRFVKVETGVREQGERLDKVEVRVDKVENRIADLEQRGPRKIATDRTASSGSVVVRSTSQRTLVAVVHVPFAFDRADLDPSAEVALTTIVAEMRDNPHITLDLEGTTDPVGTVDYNVKLSQRRVEAVKRRLLDKGIEPSRIVSSTARGPLLDSSIKNDLKRRVMVKLMKTTD